MRIQIRPPQAKIIEIRRLFELDGLVDCEFFLVDLHLRKFQLRDLQQAL